MVKYVPTHTKKKKKKKKEKERSAKDLSNDAYAMFFLFFSLSLSLCVCVCVCVRACVCISSDFLYKNLRCVYSFELYLQVDANQIVHLTQVHKKYTGCNLKTMTLLDCALYRGMCGN